MPVLSPKLREKFAVLLTRYPTPRSALVPILLFAQDELGHLGPQAVSEIAELLDESEMSIREVIGYYSMLHTRPLGRYHVQVCTNISCLLRGGEKILEHCNERLGIGHKGVTADGEFSLEEVECIGACSWAPAMQVNYDFHQELTPEKVDRVLDDYRSRGSTRANGPTIASDTAGSAPPSENKKPSIQ
jgi:NADH-quinone oxidoreductase subunit E